MRSKLISNFNTTALEILFLLNKKAMNVTELRIALGDYGAISTYLRNLENLGLIKREKRGRMVVNMITSKGKHLIRILGVRT